MATGAQTAAVDVAEASAVMARKVARVPVAARKVAATKGASPLGVSATRATEAISTQTQPSRNWRRPGPWPAAGATMPEPHDQQVREGAEAERHGGGPVPVDPGAHSGHGGEQDSDGRGDDAGQAVHVVADGVGVPEDEAEQDEQDGGAGQARAAQHVVAPAVAVAHDGGGDRVGDVVEDGGRQGLGEGAQAEHLAVEDLLGGEGAGAVEDGAGAADQVEAGGCAHGLGLAGEAQQFRVDVGDGDVLGEGDVDPAVGSHDGDPAEARRCGRTHLCDPLVGD